MGERIVYVSGDFVPESQAVVSVFDRGFRWGDAVYDAERTYGGKLFRLDQHIDRLYRSLRYTRIDPGLSKEQMTEITKRVAESNALLRAPNDDYNVVQVVSRGVFSRSRRLTGLQATVVVYCVPIGFADFARFYVEGARLVTPSIRRTPPQCVSPQAKISNKMNHLLADFESKEVDPDAYSLMLDLDGNVTENAAANFLFFSNGRLMLPNRRNVLPGTGMAIVLELARDLGIPVQEGDYTPFDVYQADEAVLTSATLCMLPVASLNGTRIGTDVPGPLTRRLLDAWSKFVGIDIVAQALSHLPAEARRVPSRVSA
jgi:branched-chain amino acid aminotransferase